MINLPSVNSLGRVSIRRLLCVATAAVRDTKFDRARSEDSKEKPGSRRLASGQTRTRPGAEADTRDGPRDRPFKPAAVKSTGAAPARATEGAQKQKQKPAVQQQVQQQQRQPPATLVVAEDPTHVPRNPKVKDGPWSEIDDKMVKAAKHDAFVAEHKRFKVPSGFVLLGQAVEDLSKLAVEYGQPSFRGKQLMDGVLKGARAVTDIPVVPKDFKQKLQDDGVRTGRSILHHSVSSPDGTRKYLLQLHDGRIVECVGIPLEASADGEVRQRLTVCVSSQVGCPMRCTFCATGKGGFARNLLPHEILDQVMTVQEEFGRRVSNVVFMGMGEPLLNLPGVAAACKLMHEQLGLSSRHITVSTVGVPNAIVRLALQDLRATLAVSIHAPNQKLRESIIPSAKAYPLDALMEDCARFFQKTGRRVTFEYTLLAGVNDQDEHAKALAQLLKQYDLASHVNVIPWNPVDESEFKRPSGNRVYAFQNVLEAAGIPCSLRITRGLDAGAACGQLRNQHQKEPLKEFAVPK